MLLPWFVLESLISVTLQIIVKWNYIQILINVIGYKTNRLDRFGIGPIMKVDDLILLPRIDDGTHASCFGNTLFDDLILILLAEKQASNSMDTLEEIKNCPFCILHTSDMASSFVCSTSRDGEALWFKSPTSCSCLTSDQFQFLLHLQFRGSFLLIQQLQTCRLYLQESTTPLPSCWVPKYYNYWNPKLMSPQG